VDGSEAGFAMCIVDQGQAKAGNAMFIDREPGFGQDLVDEAMALRVAAGTGDLAHHVARPHCLYAFRGSVCHPSARGSHEMHLQTVFRA
jgi:hypothetical protein